MKSQSEDQRIATGKGLRSFRARAIRVGLLAGCTAIVATANGCGGDSGGTTTPGIVITRIDVTAPTTTLSPTQTTQLTATPRTATGSVASTSVAWSSSANAVATVNSGGLVTAVAAGSVTITASGGGVSGSMALTVVPAGGTVVTVSVALSDASLIIGNIGQATVSARDANNAVIAIGTRALTWSSSNPAIATISSAGIVSAVGIGSTQIRASVVEGTSTVVGTATFSVVPDPDAKQTVDISMPGLTFSPSDVVVKVNGTVRFIFPSMEHNVFWRPRIAGSPADIATISNQTITRTFPTAGVFPYVCTLHDGMVGTIVVSP